MSWRVVNTIFRKELLDTFRDRRTLIAMIGVPVVLYPVLFIVVAQVVIVQRSNLEAEPSRVAVVGVGASAVQPWIEAEELLDIQGVDGDPVEGLRVGGIDALLEVDGSLEEAIASRGTLPLTIRYDVTEPRSREAANRIEDVLVERRTALLKERLDAAALPEAFARPLTIDRENIATASKTTGSILGMILPLLMIVMLGVGAFYPAVDLTAGEKERGTFETLLATPISKMEIIAGKFVAVFGLCLLTGLLNLASMAATLLFQLSQIASQAAGGAEGAELAFGSIEVPPQTLLVIAIILVPLAFFISSVMMGVSLLARSFKEAQNYVTPFFIALILPASFGALPEVQLTEVTQFIPIANVTLLFRDLLVGKATFEAGFVVFVTTAVYAVLGLVAATSLFQREEVILSRQGGMPLTFDRRVYPPRDVPSVGMAFGLFTFVMLLIFYIGSSVQLWDMHYGLLITLYGLILLPVCAVLAYTRVNLRTALNLRLPRPGAALGSLILTPAAVLMTLQLGVWNQMVLPIPPEFIEQMERLFPSAAGPSDVAWLLFVVALGPAICEESLFRGVMVSALKGRWHPAAIVVIVGILFGLFHLSVYRFFPQATIGMLLTYLALRTGSILLPALVHFALNGFVILIEAEYVPKALYDFFAAMEQEQRGFDLWQLLAIALTLCVGIAIVEASARWKAIE